MKTKLCVASATILLMLMSPASARWVYRDGSRYYQFEATDVGFLVLMALVACGAVLVISTIFVSPKPPPRAKTADEYNAEAVLLAAKRHHTEMVTELRKAEIEAARVEAIHKERGEIIQHDKRIRELNARLDEQRRAS